MPIFIKKKSAVAVRSKCYFNRGSCSHTQLHTTHTL